MKLPVLTALACLLLAASAQAHEVPTPPVTAHPDAVYISTGKWTYPSATQIKALYPERAEKFERTGKATIDCLIAADGIILACDIVAEDPKEYGFGLATATMFILYAHVKPDTVEGGLQPNSRKAFTFAWTPF